MNQIRINFDDSEWASIQLLMKEYNIGTPQKLIRSLIVTDVIRGSKARVRDSSGTGKRRMTAGEKRAKIERMSDEEINDYLRPVLEEEFRQSPEDEIYVTTPLAGGARMVHVKLVYGPRSTDESEQMLSSLLNRWEKEKRLPELSTM